MHESVFLRNKTGVHSIVYFFICLVNKFCCWSLIKVDDKYQYSSENKDLKVHGWISPESETDPTMGFWVIIPSNEFRSGGLVKQNLTSHVGPISLAVSLFLFVKECTKSIIISISWWWSELHIVPEIVGCCHLKFIKLLIF